MPRLPVLARRLGLVGVGALFAIAATACSATVALEPAPSANDPLCAEVSVRLPKIVAGEERRWTDAQATGAWGEPASVILACGVEVPGPTTLPCGEIDGVDWIIDDSDAPNYRFTTFGRTPAVEVFLDYDRVSSGDVLRQLSTAVSRLPVDRACTDRTGVTG